MKTKKRILIVLSCMIAVLFLFVVPVSSKMREADETVLTVGVPTDRCPMFYRDYETNEIVGIGADLMRTAAANAGFSVSFAEIKGATLKDALDNPEYDLIMPFGSAITSTAGAESIVSENLIQTPFTLVTQANEQLLTLNELRIGMLKSLAGGAETVRQLYPGIEITMYETMDDCVKALRRDEVDALLHNSYVWSYVLQKPAYADLKVQPSSMFSMDFRAGTLDSPKGRELIETINEGIAQLSDTRRQAVVLDYTSRRLYQYDFSDYVHEYGLFAFLVLLLFLAMIVIVLLKQRTYRMEQEERMRQLLDHDPLTGALSLNGFRKRVEELLRGNPDVTYLLSYNNIRNFKYINDSLGRQAGDDLLRFWVTRTNEVLGEQEAVARINADHLAVLRQMRGSDSIARDEQNVIEPVRNFFVDQGKEQRVQICSGVYVLTPKDYQKIDVDHMLDFARVAEKRIRESRREGLEFYNPEQWEKGKMVADVVGHLPVAIRSGELQVFYQPQVNFSRMEITGAEALCRWNHARLGWLSPAEFISTLEEAGLIFDLDRFVWESVCQDLKRWNDQGIHRSISVNLSRNDIREDRNIPGLFYDLVHKYGLNTDQLRIEITESAYVENPSLLIETTVKLREFGFQVEMDDFGSGYSSLHMLKEVPVDRIKMDLHFLTGTGDPERGRIIITHMIQLVESLGMNLIAEGVENITQARFLESHGCSEMQGFYFFKPMPVQEFEQLPAAIDRSLLSK